MLILAWKNSANRLTSRKISGIRLYWTDKNSMIYYYIMHACSKPEQYGQARFVEKVNIHAASANSRSSACKIAFALQMQKSRGVYRAARPRNRARTALTFFISGGRKFLYWNFRTTLERPTVRSCCRRNCSFADSLSLNGAFRLSVYHTAASLKEGIYRADADFYGA